MAKAADAENAEDAIVVTGKSGAYNVTRSSSATRTDTPLLEVPQSVTVLTRQVVEDLQANRVEDVLAYAGGITRGNNFGGTGLSDYNLRGFTSSEYFRNGFPMNRGYPPAPDSIAVERVDVLRGPAALLYGRGDPGGTFNIVSRMPADRMAQSVSGRIDSFGGWRGTVDATGPIDKGRTIRYRLGAAVEGGETFRDHVRSDRVVVAPAIAWDASADLTFTFSSEFVQVKTPLDRGIPAFGNQLAIAIPASRFFGEPSVDRWRVRNGLGSIVADYRIGQDWKLRAGIQYYNGELGGPGIQASSVRADGRSLVRTYSERTLRWRDLDAQTNLTGKFATGSVEHEVLLGAEFEAFHYTEVIRNSSPTLSPFTLDIFAPVYGSAIPPLNGTFTSIRTQTRTFAGYAQDQVSLLPWFRLLIGGRLERFESDNLNLRNGVTSAFKQTVFTPRVGTVFVISPQVSIYGSYARSNKPNTAADVNGNVIAPERGTSYEAGVKFEGLGGRLSATAALFHTIKQNVATADPDNLDYSIAAGEVRSRGIDISVTGNLTKAWRVVGGYVFADAEVTRDNRLRVGQRLPNAPRHSASLLNVYEFQNGTFRGLGAGAGVAYVGGRIAGTAATAPYIRPYATVNLLAYYPLAEGVKLQVNVNNLLDKKYAERGFGSNLYPGAPLAAIASITVGL
ncbi:TonB-dependent siderophore receptor [Novosphingobium gossypii]|uniref:TonB-dependent siderophore receptor n=1 Tax=Novosphingobium gossypii TaxID=1604774 RepID=UPI003D1C63FB